MVQCRDAKAQKAQEHHICHLLMEEGSKNKDEENSDEGQDLNDDGLIEEEEGTHVGRCFIFFLCITLTEYHIQFSSHPVPTKLSAVSRQCPLTYSNSKVPKVVGGHIPDLSGEVSTM